MKTQKMTIQARLTLMAYAVLIGLFANSDFYGDARKKATTTIEKIYLTTVFYTAIIRNILIVVLTFKLIFWDIPNWLS